MNKGCEGLTICWSLRNSYGTSGQSTELEISSVVTMGGYRQVVSGKDTWRLTTESGR